MAEHTPLGLPWHASLTMLGRAVDIGAADGANVGLIYGPTEGGEDDFRAKAALIVKAVNNHERLVAALKQATDNLNMARLGMDAESRKLAGELVNEYRDLLAEIDQ